MTAKTDADALRSWLLQSIRQIPDNRKRVFNAICALSTNDLILLLAYKEAGEPMQLFSTILDEADGESLPPRAR